jgi:UDP-N-acetyl-D-mannosaminuronic acid dehydrogenase
MNLSELKGKVEDRSAKLAVIGLGYVGLPVAVVFADKGFDVLGVDIKADHVSTINSGIWPFAGEEPVVPDLLQKVVKEESFRASVNYPDLVDQDVVLIAVETPVGDDHTPKYEALKAALSGLGPFLKTGALVVVESTIAPGTMKKLVHPILEDSSGGVLGEDFHLGHCPERVMPGKLFVNLTTMSRVLGGSTPETAAVMRSLYTFITDEDLDLTDWITAELVKTVENAYRDVQISCANEVALICEALGGDVWKLRELVNKSPSRQMHLPGAGVGGHCIPKDPWLLVHGAKGLEVPLRLIPTAREINDGMPDHMADLLEKALGMEGQSIKGARILVMGYAYLENTDDIRNSPSEALLKRLVELGAEAVIHDPFVTEHQGELLEKASGCHAAVVMVAHQAYKQLYLKELKVQMLNPILIDGRNVFTRRSAKRAGFKFFGIGQGFEMD